MEQDNALSGQEVGPNQSQPGDVSPEPPTTEGQTMENLLEEQGLNLDFPAQGEIREGFIAALRENEVLVSIGTKSEGVISGRELEQIPANERADFEVGQAILVFVIAPEDANGNVVLSYSRAREERDWERVELLKASGEIFESKIIGYNKGGLIVPLGGLRGFVPASQVSLLRRSNMSGDTPEQRWGKMVGELIQVRVIEVDRERRRLILSERQALQETRETLKERLLDELKEGDIRTGRVTSLADFGAFVNIDGADGLVHLSEISWERINHPKEVLTVGQEVRVKVISVDQDRKRIGLSIRQLQRDPWLDRVEHLKEGMLVEGTITHLTKFGAFARLDEDLEGLIHISELKEQRVTHPKEVVHEGEVLTLRVIKIDPERRRIGLSLRKVDSAAYADLDWKMALAEEVDKVKEETSGVPGEELEPEQIPSLAAEEMEESVTLEETEVPEAGLIQEEAEIPEEMQVSEEAVLVEETIADEELPEETVVLEEVIILEETVEPAEMEFPEETAVAEDVEILEDTEVSEEKETPQE